ncbi:MAG: hypothetical protein QNJ97_17900 [Myxococcota bacterium]|nr:hypothetical protein [Myxococcota bacterium]
MKAIAGALSGILKPAQKAHENRVKRKMASEAADAKLKLAKHEGAKEVTLTDAEWEAKSADAQGETWRDEYVTVSVVAPLNALVIGVFAAGFGQPQILDRTLEAFTKLQEAGIDMNWYLGAVIMAAIGLKAWRKVL